MKLDLLRLTAKAWCVRFLLALREQVTECYRQGEEALSAEGPPNSSSASSLMKRTFWLLRGQVKVVERDGEGRLTKRKYGERDTGLPLGASAEVGWGLY